MNNDNKDNENYGETEESLEVRLKQAKNDSDKARENTKAQQKKIKDFQSVLKEWM